MLFRLVLCIYVRNYSSMPLNYSSVYFSISSLLVWITYELISKCCISCINKLKYISLKVNTIIFSASVNNVKALVEILKIIIIKEGYHCFVLKCLLEIHRTILHTFEKILCLQRSMHRRATPVTHQWRWGLNSRYRTEWRGL